MAASERRYTKTVRDAAPTDDDVDAVDVDAVDVDAEDIDSQDVDDDAVDTEGADRDDVDAADVDAADVDPDDVGISDDVYQQRITLYEEELAQRRQSAIAAGRRKGGALGAAMAGAMLAVQEVLEKPKEEAPVIVEANSDPEDLDADGITVELEGTNYHTPPLERIEKERKTGTL